MAKYAAIAATSRAIPWPLEAAAASESEFSAASFAPFGSAYLQQPLADRLGVSRDVYYVIDQAEALPVNREGGRCLSS